MATLSQIFGQYTGGIKPDDRKVTGADFLSAIGAKKEPTLPASGVPWSEVQAPKQNMTVAQTQTQPSAFVTRKPTVQQNGVPTPTVAPTPTIADLYRDVNVPQLDDTETDLDRALARQSEFGRKQSMEKFDERAIRDDVMSLYQAEIDALNQIYAQQRAEVQQQGLGTLGSARAIQARSGLLGSDFAQAQTSNIERDVRRQVQLVDAEKGAKISALIGEGRAAAAQEIANKRKAIQEGLQSYVQYLGAQQERKKSKLAGLAQALIDQGIRPDEISPEQIKEIAKTYGVLEQDIASAYTAREKELLEEQRATGGDPFTLSEGESRFVYNPTTGSYEQVAASAPKATGTNAELTTVQKTKVDSINAVRAQLANYRQLVENSVGGTGGNQFGSDSAQLRTAKSALEFAIANAVGTGALQAADRAVVQEIIPDPTTFLGAPDRWVKGGKAGVLESIDEASKIFDSNLQAIQGSSGSLTSGGDEFAESWD